VSAWKLTIRHGSDVDREGFDDLDEAIAAAERRLSAIKAEGPLEEVTSLRDFAPADQVHARLEISGRGLVRPPTAGIDLRGDGSVVPYSGGIKRQELTPRRGADAFDSLREALRR
jgi:hypothetical protein